MVCELSLSGETSENVAVYRAELTRPWRSSSPDELEPLRQVPIVPHLPRHKKGEPREHTHTKKIGQMLIVPHRCMKREERREHRSKTRKRTVRVYIKHQHAFVPRQLRHRPKDKRRSCMYSSSSEREKSETFLFTSSTLWPRGGAIPLMCRQHSRVPVDQYGVSRAPNQPPYSVHTVLPIGSTPQRATTPTTR